MVFTSVRPGFERRGDTPQSGMAAAASQTTSQIWKTNNPTETRAVRVSNAI